MTSVGANCVAYSFIFTLVPLPNESPVALLSPLLHVGLPLVVVHGVGRCSPHRHLLHCCLLHALPGRALGLLLFIDEFHAAHWESLRFPHLVDLGGWALRPCVPGASALGGHGGLVAACWVPPMVLVFVA